MARGETTGNFPICESGRALRVHQGGSAKHSTQPVPSETQTQMTMRGRLGRTGQAERWGPPFTAPSCPALTPTDIPSPRGLQPTGG